MQLTGPKVWGEYPDHDKGVALLREVIASGVRFIDTADLYGPHSNEEFIREALHPYPDDLVIATKGGFMRGGPEYADLGAVGNPMYLRQAADMSRRRLGVGQIALYYLHTPTMTDAPFKVIVETLAGLTPGRRNPAHRPVECQRRSVAHGDGHHRHRRRDGALQLAVRLGGDVRRVAESAGLVFSPWHPGAIPKGQDGAPFRAVIDPIGARHDATPQQIALAWQLHRTSSALPIPGTASVQHLAENVAAARIALTADEIDAITALAPEV